MKSKSLRKQLILSLCISLAIICVIGNFAVFSYIKQLDLQEFDKELIHQAQTLISFAQPNKQEFGLQEFLPVDKTTHYQLWSEDGKILVHSSLLMEEKLPFFETPLGEVEIRDILLPDGSQGRMATLTFIPRSNEGQGPQEAERHISHKQVYLAYAKSRESLDHILNVELSFSLVIGGFLIASAACVVFMLVNRSFRKFEDFADQIQTIELGSISRRLNKNNLPSEFIPVCDQFNSLLDRLEASFIREKRFNANIGHELRTPIAELRVLAEVGLQEIDSSSTHRSFRPYFEDALQLATGMERIVEVLTLLNQLGTKKIRPTFDSFSLDVVIRDLWKTHEPEAQNKNITCSWQISEHIQVHSDRALMAALLDNVIQNAITHSPNDAMILCRAYAEGLVCKVEFVNPSKDLSSQDLPLLSEPFWQKDMSRTNTKHLGLGLTLVEAYCNILSITSQMWLDQSNQLHTLFEIPNLSGEDQPPVDNQLRSNTPSKIKQPSTTLRLLLGSLLILLTGCVSTSLDYTPTLDSLERNTGFRSGLKNTPYSTVIPEGISLEDGLTLEEAITLALWNNAAFQETLSGLGLSHAAVIQAHMLPNPTFWILFPIGPKQLEFAARIPFEALWFIPQRVAAAQRDFEEAAKQLVQHGITLVRDVKVAAANLFLAENRLQLTLHQAKILQQIARVNLARVRAGAISELEAASSRLDALGVDEQIQQLKHEFELAQEHYRVLLGLGLEYAPVTSTAPSTVLSTNRSVKEMLSDALATRPDLRAAELAIEAAGERAGLAQKEIFTVLGIFDVNGGGKGTGNSFQAGPGLEIMLPIFNQNQGLIALTEAGFDQAIRRYITVRDQIVLEVRQSHSRWQQAIDSLRLWQKEILPAHHAAMIQAQQALKAGQVTPLVPLTARHKWNEARIREIELLTNHQRATAELERSIGHVLDGHQQSDHLIQISQS